jgi:hypothetical protein
LIGFIPALFAGFYIDYQFPVLEGVIAWILTALFFAAIAGSIAFAAYSFIVDNWKVFY